MQNPRDYQSVTLAPLLDLAIVRILVQLQTVQTVNDLVDISNVQDEQQDTKNGPLRYSELHWTDWMHWRQLTVIEDLLRPAGNE